MLENTLPRKGYARKVIRTAEIQLGVEDEATVIGAALTNRAIRRRVVPMLKPSDFVDEKHQTLWKVIGEMDRRGLDWSEDTVLSLHPRREDWGDFLYLRQLHENYGEARANMEFHVQRIKLSRLKEWAAKDFGALLLAFAEDPKTDAEGLIALGQKLVSQASIHARVRRYDWHQAMTVARDAFRSRRQRGRSEVIGFESEAMDSVFSYGLAPGRCSVIGAPPGVGKTTWAVALGRRRFKRGRGTCYIACEMSDAAEIPLMFAAAELRIPFLRLLNQAHEMSDAEHGAFKKFLNDFHAAGPDAFEIVLNPFVYDDEPLDKDGKRRVYPGDLNRRNLAILESIIAATPHKLVVLDMIGHALIEEDVQLLNRGLLAIKNMAERHGVHILLLHHLNRGDARAKNPRPRMKDFRGASGFENYMHNVLMAYRPQGARHRGAPEGIEPFELMLGKQKVGAPVIVVSDFEPRFMDFTNDRIRLVGPAVKDDEDAGESGIDDI